MLVWFSLFYLNRTTALAAAPGLHCGENIIDKTHAINQIANENATDARQTSSGSHELTLLAVQMEGLVTQFLLDESGQQMNHGHDGDKQKAEASQDNIELF